MPSPTLFALLIVALPAPPALAALDCYGTSDIDKVMSDTAARPDSEITKLCFYDLQTKHANASEAAKSMNIRRTYTCEQSFKEMRRLAGDYRERKNSYCLELKKNPANCLDRVNDTQLFCLTSAKGLTEEARRLHIELRDIAIKSKAAVEKIARYQIVRQKDFEDELREMRNAFNKMPAAQQFTARRGPTMFTNGGPGKRPINAGIPRPGSTVSDSVNELPPTGTRRPIISPSAKTTPGDRIPGSQQPSPQVGSPRASPAQTAYNPGGSGTIRAGDLGVRTIGEYEARLSQLIQEKAKLIRETERLEAGFKKAEVKHQATAVELGITATKILAAAKSLGPSDQKEAEANAKVPQEVDAPTPREISEFQDKEAQSQPADINGAVAENTLEPELAPTPALAALTALAPQEESAMRSAVARAQEYRAEHQEETGEYFSGEKQISNDPGDSIARVSSLKDSLRRKMQRSEGESEKPNTAAQKTNSSTELVADLIREQRNLSSAPATTPLSRAVTPGVQAAVADVEAQVGEILESIGILGSNTENLFRRVHSAHTRCVKNGLLKQ